MEDKLFAPNRFNTLGAFIWMFVVICFTVVAFLTGMPWYAAVAIIVAFLLFLAVVYVSTVRYNQLTKQNALLREELVDLLLQLDDLKDLVRRG